MHKRELNKPEKQKLDTHISKKYPTNEKPLFQNSDLNYLLVFDVKKNISHGDIISLIPCI